MCDWHGMFYGARGVVQSWKRREKGSKNDVQVIAIVVPRHPHHRGHRDEELTAGALALLGKQAGQHEREVGERAR